jgi:signal transduction histidine kinase/DNA-binding response OmpR family regulator
MEPSLRFLAQASQSLSALVDYQSALGKVAHLAVPDFADWCAVDMLNPKGAVERVAIAHRDPRKNRLAEKLHEKPPSDWESPRGAMKVLRTGESDWVLAMDDGLLVQLARDDEHLELLRELNPASYLCVPLRTKQKILGAMTFLFAESGRHYRPEDLVVAEDLARRATSALENALLYQEIQEAHRRKDEFLAMLAHELRNPLVPIRSGLDILALDDQGDRELIQVMQDQVNHVVRLVDDLLDVSRIIQNKIALRKETVELSVLVKQSVEAVREHIDAHQQEFLVQIPEEPIWLDADPVRLVQILENLLNNAAKYTEDHGRIELSARIQNGEACIQIQDTGIGIEPDLLPSVFEIFTQSSRSLDRAKGGLGIGLTLVQRLVEMHGGTVAAHSEGLGQGSTFTVRLPLANPPTVPQKANADWDQGLSRRIAVVDDNVGASKLLSRLLGMLGDHQIRMAHDGNAALELIREMRPEIVLLDIGLPGKNGYQVAKAIRQHSEFHDLLLVALTGYGQQEDVQKSKEAGFDLHCVKPPSLDQMKDILKHPKLKTRKRTTIPEEGMGGSTRPLASQTSENDRQVPGASAVDLPQLRHDLNNVAYVLSLVREMFQTHGDNPQVVGQALEALDNEVQRVNRLVEKLKT